MVTEISKGRSAVGTTAIQNLVLTFGISANWLLTGQGDMFHNESATSVQIHRKEYLIMTWIFLAVLPYKRMIKQVSQPLILSLIYAQEQKCGVT